MFKLNVKRRIGTQCLTLLMAGVMTLSAMPASSLASTTDGYALGTKNVNVALSNDSKTHEHDYSVVITKKPTATEEGLWTYTCDCGESYTRKIPKITDGNIKPGLYMFSCKDDEDKYLSVSPNKKNSGNIEVYSRGEADQIFTVSKNSNGTYSITYKNGSLNLEGGKFGGKLQIRTTREDNERQQWYIEPAGDGYYRIVSAATYYNADVFNGNMDNGTSINTHWDNKTSAQLFKLEPIASDTKFAFVQNGTYMLRNIGTGYVMNYSDENPDRNVLMTNYDKTSDALKFKVAQEGQGVYTIQSCQPSGFLLDCKSGLPVKNGTKITAKPSVDSDSQKFYIVPVAVGTYVIQNASCRGLIIGADSKDLNSTLSLQKYDAADKNQLWELIDPSVKPTATPTPKPTATSKPTAVPTNTPKVTATPAVTQRPASKDAKVLDFVNRIYKFVLNREPEKEGAAYWTSELVNLRKTGAEVAQGFIFSDEFVNRKTSDKEFVTILYKTFFGRDPETEGLNYWVDQLKTGAMDRTTVANGFIFSQEWTDTCAQYGIKSGAETSAPTNDKAPTAATLAFVERMYTTALKRDFDKQGRDYWASELANQRITGESLGLSFFLSDEMTSLNLNDKEFINRLYKTFMDRDADAAGEEFWQEFLKSHTRAEGVLGFTRSPEFTQKCVDAQILPY